MPAPILRYWSGCTPSVYCSAISDQSLSEAPEILSYISRTYACLSLKFSPANTRYHVILDVVTVLIREMDFSIPAVYDCHAIHVVLIAIPRALRRILLQTGSEFINPAVVNEPIVGIHVDRSDSAIGKQPHDRIDSIEPRFTAPRLMTGGVLSIGYRARFLAVYLIQEFRQFASLFFAQQGGVQFTGLQQFSDAPRTIGQIDFAAPQNGFLVAGQ